MNLQSLHRFKQSLKVCTLVVKHQLLLQMSAHAFQHELFPLSVRTLVVKHQLLLQMSAHVFQYELFFLSVGRPYFRRLSALLVRSLICVGNKTPLWCQINLVHIYANLICLLMYQFVQLINFTSKYFSGFSFQKNACIKSTLFIHLSKWMSFAFLHCATSAFFKLHFRKRLQCLTPSVSCQSSVECLFLPFSRITYIY